MKKNILLFFILKTLLFSSGEFITSNGKLSFKYNEKYNKIMRFNGDMGSYKSDIDSIEVGVYYKGEHYILSDYIVSKRFIPKTNIFETIAELPYGEIKTTYIPSMVDKNSFYIVNNYDIKKDESLEFLYLFNMSDRNGVVEYKKTKDYYKYNENIYIKNLKNSMEGYIIPVSDLDVVKIKKIDDVSIKYRDERMIMSSKIRLLDSEKSDIVQIKYGKTPDFLSFESSERLLSLEEVYWKKWLNPIPKRFDENTQKIIERFLIYLKTSSDGFDHYTNIGLRETSKTKDTLYTAITFIKYGYLDDANQILTGLINEEEEFSYLNRSRLTLEEVKEVFVYLMYIKESKDAKFYTEHIEKNLNLLGGIYLNDLSRIGDINLFELNEDIEKNAMKIPNKIYLQGEKKYEINGIDIYLTSKYLNTIYDRSEE